jgi:competence protein ComEC
LLSGDAEDDQEAYLVDTYRNQLESTVLKAGHHGSSSSSSEPFLDTVAPQTVVVSSAYDSQYGHPTETVLQRFADRSIPAFWTATHGNTVFVSNGTTVSVRTQQPAPTEPTALRDGSSIPPGTSGEVTERLLLTGDGTTTVDSDSSESTDGSDEKTTPADDSATNFEIVDINADAEGDDRENLNDEYVTFQNTGEQPLDISGWTLEDAADHSYTFPEGTTVDPQATITVRTGSGTNTDTDLYWGSGSPIWNNGGDTIIVQTADGTTVLEETY